MAVFLVCEGPPGGLDDRLLDRLVVQRHGLTVVVKAIGGSDGLGAVSGFLRAQNYPTDVAVAVRDRDYWTAFADADASWANTAGHRFVWRRHEIENYLLHPAAVLRLFDTYRLTQPWAAALPTTEPAVLALLQQIASPLIENHTGEVLKAELVGHADRSRLRFTPPKLGGSPFLSQAVWLPALQQEASRLSAACQTAAALPAFQHHLIAIRFSSLLAQFQLPAFLSGGDFVRDMGGHELVRALESRLRLFGAPPQTDQAVADDLLESLDKVYTPGITFQPDDFQQLATILAQYP